MIGRGAELERLRSAVRAARDADRCVVLLSGEAGIGKSRLLADFERSAHDDPPTGRPVVTLTGGCVDVGGTLAYLPIIELLDGAGQLGAGIGDAATVVRQTLDGSTIPATEADVARAPAARATSFVRIRDLLAAAAADRDVIAVIDDLQWADRSTLDVVLFLARRLVRSGVLIVLAYRSEDLNRRHPLKPVLADLERHATLDHIRVEPLNAVEVRAQVTGILGMEPDRAWLDRIVRLADGNPFHVEELLSLQDQRGLPPSLHEVLAARLDQLTDESRRVVQQAAVIGRDVGRTLLGHVCAHARLDAATGLREAVDALILLPADDGRRYRFRHALLGEAAYEDLSPDQRIDAHRRIAQALTDHPAMGDPNPGVAIADRARHWLAAGSEPEAFAAQLEAARSAAAAAGWAEACAAYEEALALWERIENPAQVANATRAEILEQAAEIAWHDGDARRAVALNRRAQAEPDVIADPIRLGRLAARSALLYDDLGEVTAEGEAAETAVRLIPPQPPSIERAEAVSSLGLHAIRRGRMRDAAELFEQAIAVAAAVGADGDVAANMAFLTIAWVEQGEMERPAEAIARLDGLVRQISDPFGWSVVATWAPWAWLGMGDYERAIDYAERLLVDARVRGMDRGVGLWCLAPRALAEFWLGRWDDAIATIGRQGDYTWGIDAAVYLRSVAARVAAGQGDLARARALAEEAVEISRTGLPEQAMVAAAASAWVELLDDRPAVALDHVRAVWPVARTWEGLVSRSPLLWLGLWAAADLAAATRSRDGAAVLGQAAEFASELSAAAVTAIRELGAAPPTAPAGPRLVLQLAAAEGARLESGDDPATWAELAEQLTRHGDLPRAYLARQRQAEAALRARDRPHAAVAIEAALRIADQIGAPRLRRRAMAVVQAARLKLGSTAGPVEDHEPAPADEWGLSKREREILALLGGGRTNRQIGEALFISEKTASVHVSHIMAKLGVSSRTEAALLAVRARLGDAQEEGATASVP